MSLTILDANKEIINGPLVTTHNGFTGGDYQMLIFLKNQHPEFYYHDVSLKIEMSDLVEGEIFSNSGWSVKLKYGSEQPTEKQWGDIIVNNQISIPDIGSQYIPDTDTYHPVWIRVFCPGHTTPDIKKDMNFSLMFFRKLVGETE